MKLCSLLFADQNVKRCMLHKWMCRIQDDERKGDGGVKIQFGKNINWLLMTHVIKSYTFFSNGLITNIPNYKIILQMYFKLCPGQGGLEIQEDFSR